MRRFTITDLRRDIEEINNGLQEIGALVRFEISPRNGYQAVDEYPIGGDGKRIGSGVNRMVGSGSSRETALECWQAYRGIQRQTVTA